jgi:hypothetical protein
MQLQVSSEGRAKKRSCTAKTIELTICQRNHRKRCSNTLGMYCKSLNRSQKPGGQIPHKLSCQRLVRLSTLFCITKLHDICVNPPSHVSDPLSHPGSHALAKLPIGGYLCPSRSTRGAQVHHCSDGMFSMTPGTCLPQPHHVVLSVEVSAVLMVGGIRVKARE